MQSKANAIRLTEELVVEDVTSSMPGKSLGSGISASPSAASGPDLRSYTGNNIGGGARVDSSDSRANESKGKTKLEESLTCLARLIANVTESYTTAIFVADVKNQVLHSLAHHSLSRDYLEAVTIPYGRGLVGWTAENKARIAVCPFEHDARTLLYYPSDQALKSFIAVPILSAANDLVGVIVCDSKKSYAFPKLTEKILADCAAQANLLINLHQANESLLRKAPQPKKDVGIVKVIEAIRASNSEEELFEVVCTLPQEIVARDAFIALVTSHDGYGEPTFYSHSPESRYEHHLVDLVCKSKKVICAERSVHVLPSDDIRARSFLSVPFHVFGQEAGALNILSAALKPFSTQDIQALEEMALVIGRELGRLRSSNIAKVRQVGPSMLPWKHFAERVERQIQAGNCSNLSLARFQLGKFSEMEKQLGVAVCAEVHEQLLRFIQQLAPMPMLVSSPYGTSTFLFGDSGVLESVALRVRGLLAKIHSVNSGARSKSQGPVSSLLQDLDSRSSSFIADCLDVRITNVKSGYKKIEQLIYSLPEEKFSESLGSVVNEQKPVQKDTSSESSSDLVKSTKNEEESGLSETASSAKVSNEPVHSGDLKAETISEKVISNVGSMKAAVYEEWKVRPSDRIPAAKVVSSDVDSADAAMNMESSSSEVVKQSSSDRIQGKERKSIEEFILGDAAGSRSSDYRSKIQPVANKGRGNARFW